MRLGTLAMASFALALFTASPAALAQDGGGGDAADHGQSAARLMRAADGFDRRAASMHFRAGALRTVALNLRREAEDLAADGGASTDPTTSDPAGPADPTAAPASDPCADWGADEPAFGRHDAPGPFDQAADNDLCQLLAMADRLERRADALDTAAERMSGHAATLRAKAQDQLAGSGNEEAQRLLERAKRFHARAQELRDRADQMRDTAFTGANVDDDTIERVQHMETKAATFDGAADRLEARAAKLACATPAS